MKARVSLVARPVIPVKAKVAAGTSSIVRLLKVTSGCPSLDGQRTVASARTEEKSEPPFRHHSLSIEAAMLRVALRASTAKPWPVLSAPILGCNSSIHSAACASSVGMLHRPNTRSGCGSKSVA